MELSEADVMAVGREGEGKPQPKLEQAGRLALAEPFHSKACLRGRTRRFE